MEGRDPGEAHLEDAQPSMCQVLRAHPGELRGHREHRPLTEEVPDNLHDRRGP